MAYYYICILGGDNFLPQVLTKESGIPLNTIHKRGDICNVGKDKGIPYTYTNAEIVNRKYIHNLDALLKLLLKHYNTIQHSGVDSILVQEIAVYTRKDLHTALSEEQIDLLAALGCDYQLLFYSI